MPTPAPALVRIVLSLCLTLAATVRAADHDRWYTVEIDGQRAGWMHASQTTADGRITTTTRMEVAIRRGTTPVSIALTTRFVETEAGEPVEMSVDQRLGSEPVAVRYRFGAEGVGVETTQGGRTTRGTLPAPEGRWLPPAAASRYLEQRLAAGADPIVLRTMDPQGGPTVIEIRREGLEATTIEVLGRSLDALRCRTSSSDMPVGSSTVEVIDRRGVSLRTELDLGGMKMAMYATDEATASVRIEAPELLLRSFVRPDRRIDTPRGVREADYTLSVPDGTLPDLPSGGAQGVERLDDSRARVVVRSDDPRTESPDLDTAPFLASSAMADSGDPVIVQLTECALRGVQNGKAGRAEALRRFVGRHINAKTLGVGFASASEVARTREGDCTEHAVLLAAMLRADGIPSRVVSGLIYADRFEGERDVFVYHMWTQALLPIGESYAWIDLDATLGPIPFDATHIALAESALSDGEAARALTATAPLIGRLRVEVESTGERP
ncbi:MAG: transglutaminase domain-containing protein [Phycisphaeraceae bacterium]|nr:transglutaminase domain-containing protein [Phycisphaeraceae bacterium]